MIFKKKESNDKNEYYNNIAALLIHAAKIDENYSSKEEEIIKKTLLKLNANIIDLEEIIKKGKKKEQDSNHILNFTKEIKSLPEEKKIQIIESLWQIIYSDKNADMYETNLMRRLAGLLYIDNKIMGNIKDKFKKN